MALDPDSAFRRHLGRLNQLIGDGGSLSGQEKNCTYLNLEGARFANVSSVSGLDFADDARTPLAVDWDHDGDLDLWVGNRTAPQLRFLRNDTPNDNHHVALRLHGTRANRDGIGARVEVWQPNQDVPLIKTLKAGEGFLGQSSKWLHFGIGKSKQISRVVVRWPGGAAEAFSGVQGDHRYALTEGQGEAEVVAANVVKIPAHPEIPIRNSQPIPSRHLTSTQVALPSLRYQSKTGEPAVLPIAEGRPVLINLWASWCAPCAKELTEWKQHASELENAGIDVWLVSVDDVDDNGDSSSATTSALLEELDLPFHTVMANDDMLVRIEQALNWPYGRRFPIALPTSLLLNGEGRMVTSYYGSVSAQQIIDDVRLLGLDFRALRELALPFEGKWLFPPHPQRPMIQGIKLMDEGDVTDAADFVNRNLELLKPHKEFPLLAIWISEELLKAGERDEGIRYLKLASQGNTADLTVANNIAWQLAASPDDMVRDPMRAIRWAEKANALSGGKMAAVLDTLSVAYAANGDFPRAIHIVKDAIKIADTDKDQTLAESLRSRLKLFESGKPYRDPKTSR